MLVQKSGRSTQVRKLSTKVTMVAIFISALLGSQTMAQEPGLFDSPQNLHVLPVDISPADLQETMNGFQIALGVKCVFCHDVGMPDSDLREVFKRDTKATKRNAREMLRMMLEMNRRIGKLEKNDEHTFAEVTCISCHRGQTRPILIQTALDEALAEGGAEAAIRKYNELKDHYFGSGTFDFSPFTLSRYAKLLVNNGSVTDGLSLAIFSAEINPDTSYPQTTLGDINMTLGQFSEAIQAYENSLSITPEVKFVQRRLKKAREALAAQN